MLQLLSSGWVQVAIPAATALFCLASCITILNAAFLNRGAKVNIGWSLIAVGLFLIAAAYVDRVLEAFGLPNLSAWRDLAVLIGALLVFCGTAYGRDLLKRLVK